MLNNTLFMLTGKEKCSPAITSVRLVGLNSSVVGYLEVCRDEYWEAVMLEEEHEWTHKNSIVVCRELGFGGTVEAISSLSL